MSSSSSSEATYSPVLLGSEHSNLVVPIADEDMEGKSSGHASPTSKAEETASKRSSAGFTLFAQGAAGILAICLASLVLVLTLSLRGNSSGKTPVENAQSQQPAKTYLNAEQSADAIDYLPGWSPLPLPSAQYSGFLDANETGSLQMHYWLVEAEESPETKPLLLWFNGGPGASSLYGLLVELGPFLLSDSSLKGDVYLKTGIPQLLYNPSHWAKVANVVALSMPPPIGFSYCLPKGPSATGNDCGPWNDFSTAQVTYTAIKSFFKRFPQYADRDVWLSGESYAGVYVPEIVKLVLANQPQNGINLKGFLVGDACTPPAICGAAAVGPYWNIEFLYGKGAISNKLYDEIFGVCSQDELRYGVKTDPCQQSVNKVSTEAGGYWAYGFYDDCWYENDIRRARARRMLTAQNNGDAWNRNTPGYFEYYGPPIAASSRIRGEGQGRSLAGGEFDLQVPASRVVNFPNGYQCGGPGAQIEWLSRPEVKKALNVPEDAVFFQSDNGVGFTYTFGESDLISWYKEIVSQNKLRVVVYNGDVDPCINSLQAQDWVSKLGFTEVQSWRPWTLDGCQYMGGYVTRYENGLDFVTIRGSGHMVPQFKPKAALEMLASIIGGTELKSFNPTCSSPPL